MNMVKKCLVVKSNGLPCNFSSQPRRKKGKSSITLSIQTQSDKIFPPILHQGADWCINCSCRHSELTGDTGLSNKLRLWCLGRNYSTFLDQDEEKLFRHLNLTGAFWAPDPGSSIRPRQSAPALYIHLHLFAFHTLLILITLTSIPNNVFFFFSNLPVSPTEWSPILPPICQKVKDRCQVA